MERVKYSFLIGAALVAGAFLAIQMNAVVGQTGEGVVPLNATETQSDANAGNFTITEEGLGNGTMPASIPVPVDTAQLKLHINEAKIAMQTNDTQSAMDHMVLALEEIEMILGGNATTTANSTDTATAGMPMNSTG